MITKWQARAARQLAAAFGHLWATPPGAVIQAERNGDTGAVAAWEADIERVLVEGGPDAIRTRTLTENGGDAFGIAAPSLAGDGEIWHKSSQRRLDWSIFNADLVANVSSGSMSYLERAEGGFFQAGPVVTVLMIGGQHHVVMTEGRYRDDHADLAGRIMEALELPLDSRIVAARERIRTEELARHERIVAEQAAQLSSETPVVVRLGHLPYSTQAEREADDQLHVTEEFARAQGATDEDIERARMHLGWLCGRAGEERTYMTVAELMTWASPCPVAWRIRDAARAAAGRPV